MSLSDLASLGSFVSGVAVLVSLVFLYFQLRQLRVQVAQTEANQRTMINESYVARISEALRWNALQENRRLTVRINQGDQDFSADELIHLHLLLRQVVLSTQAVQQHYGAGLIDRETYETQIIAFKYGYLAHPVFRAIWAAQADRAPASIRRLVEELIREVPSAAPRDMVADFKRQLAKVVADETAAPTSAWGSEAAIDSPP